MVDKDKDTGELQSQIEVIPDEEEVAIDVVPLDTKPPTIVDWKIHKEGKNNYFQIITTDGSLKMYLVFSQLLKSVDREDLVELYKLVAKYGSTRPMVDMDLLLWGDLKTILQSGMIYMLVEKRYPLTPPIITDMLNKKLQYKVNVAEGVNATSEEVSTAELVSTAYLKEFDLLKWDQQHTFSQYSVSKNPNTPYRRSSIRHTQEVQYTVPEGFDMPYPGGRICHSSSDESNLGRRLRLTKASYNAGQARKETKPVKKYILLPLWTADLPISQNPKSSHDDGSKPSSDVGKKVDEDPRKERECNDQEKDDNVDSTNNVNVAGTNEINAVGEKTSIELPFDPNMPALEDYRTFDFLRDDEDNGAKADINNLDTTIQEELKRIEAIRLFLAYASFKDFVVYQMDVKSAFLYGKIEEEGVWYCNPGFDDPYYLVRVYKVEKIDFYGLHQAPRACTSKKRLALFLQSKITLLMKFLMKIEVKEVKTTSTPMETQKPLSQDESGEEVDVHNLWSTAKAKTINWEVQLHARVDGKEIVITESFVKRDLQLEDEEGIDCLPNSTIFENLAFMGYEKLSDKLTFYKSFFSLQWKFLIHTILQCLSPKTTGWNDFSSAMASAIICLATNQKFNFSIGFLLILGLEDELKQTKTTHNHEVAKLKKKVKKLENRTRSRTYRLKRLHKVEMYDVGTVTGDEVFVEQEVAAKDVNLTVDEVTLAQALSTLKYVKPKVIENAIEEPNVPINAVSASTKHIDLKTISGAYLFLSLTIGIRATEALDLILERNYIADKVHENRSRDIKVKVVNMLGLGLRSVILGLVVVHDHKLLILICPVLDYDKKGKKMLTGVCSSVTGLEMSVVALKIKSPQKMSKKDQLRSDEEEAKRLQAEFDEEERLALGEKKNIKGSDWLEGRFIEMPGGRVGIREYLKSRNVMWVNVSVDLVLLHELQR
ncbi:retrovirus-related pol polyprotein from transposon TNT 1-94 [Tanacetum coccineum]